MGNMFFGGIPTNAYNLYFRSDVTPHPLEKPSNEPCLGFAERKIRHTDADYEDYYSAKLELQDRDYCADHLLTFRACRRDYWPFPVFCGHEKHVYLNCVYDDWILRMKEYERERRLLARGIIKKPVKEEAIMITNDNEVVTTDNDKIKEGEVIKTMDEDNKEAEKKTEDVEPKNE